MSQIQQRLWKSSLLHGRFLFFFFFLSPFLLMTGQSAWSQGIVPQKHSQVNLEPTLQEIMNVWEELPNKWTTVGWKHHRFRFNVLYDGTLMARPNTNGRTGAFAKQGFLLKVCPTYGKVMIGKNNVLARFGMLTDRYREDDRIVVQGWCKERIAPVLWSEWSVQGYILRMEVFAHVPGGGLLQSGEESLFAWIRYSISDLYEGLPKPDALDISLQLSGAHVSGRMDNRNNLFFDKEDLVYPRRLVPKPESYDAQKPWYLIHPDGKVRLAVAANGDSSVMGFSQNSPAQGSHLISFSLPPVKGAHIDILAPMLATDDQEFDQELNIGFDRALEEAESFWSKVPSTAAAFNPPEPHIRQAIMRCLQMAEVIAEFDPNKGIIRPLTGSWSYCSTFPTPISMTLTMLLDNLGYHEAVERYINPLIEFQGKIKPPSPFLDKHPGYLTWRPVWLGDHGAIMHAVANHALLTGNEEFIDLWLPALIKGCEFIQNARQTKVENAIPGLMPPGRATDIDAHFQSVWIDGWMFKGLSTSVRLLERRQHPRFKEFYREMKDYRECFEKEFRKQNQRAPIWHDQSGRQRRLVSAWVTTPSGDTKVHSFDYNNFFLDCGPLVLVYCGLMEANDPLMQDALSWFREGPPAQFGRHDQNWFHYPFLDYEISSCEPCYSFNLYHSLSLEDRYNLLKGVYSQIAGMHSKQTYTMCESRGGVSGLTPSTIWVDILRRSIVEDRLEPDKLDLLRMMPLSWLKKNSSSVFTNLPTDYGPVSLEIAVSDDESVLDVKCKIDWREQPDAVRLYIPPLKGLNAIKLNGHKLKMEPSKSYVEITEVVL